MSQPQNILQKIEDYLDNKLDKTDRELFEKQINEDLQLKELVSLNKNMRQNYDDTQWHFIKDANNNLKITELEIYFKSEDAKSAKALLERVENKYQKESNLKRPKFNNYSIIAVAAMVIIFLGFFVNNNYLKNEDIYLSSSNWYDLPSLVSKNDSNNQRLVQGEKAFLNQEYSVAKNNFETFINNNQTINSNVLIYYGLSQFELNETKSAIQTFNKLINSEHIDSSKGYWFKALIYLKMKEKDKALEQLNIIVKDSKKYNYKKAVELIKKINE